MAKICVGSSGTTRSRGTRAEIEALIRKANLKLSGIRVSLIEYRGISCSSELVLDKRELLSVSEENRDVLFRLLFEIDQIINTSTDVKETETFNGSYDFSFV